MVLAEVLKNMTPQHEDHSLVARALSEVEQVVETVNRNVAEAQNRQQVLRIQEQFVSSSSGSAAPFVRAWVWGLLSHPL